MAIVISISNHKGGVGKTTTAVNLATIFNNQRGHKTLLIDADKQCNSSATYSVSTENTVTLYDVLVGDSPITDAIVHTKYGDIIPASPKLTIADMMLSSENENHRLDEEMEKIKDAYDFIIIDTRTDINTLLYNCLVASDEIIVPVSPDYYSEQGIIDLYKTIQQIKKRDNPKLDIAGVLHVRYKKGTNLSSESNEDYRVLANRLGTQLFDTPISETVKVGESTKSLMPVVIYWPNCSAASDYIQLADSLLKYLQDKESSESKEA